MQPTYIPRDIADYEERVFFGLTGRQLFWAVIAIGTGTGTFILNTRVFHLDQDLAMYITIAIAFGLFFMGWRKWQGVRPYTDKVKAWWTFTTRAQQVFYSNGKEWMNFGTVRKKRKDKKINKRFLKEF